MRQNNDFFYIRGGCVWAIVVFGLMGLGLWKLIELIIALWR